MRAAILVSLLTALGPLAAAEIELLSGEVLEGDIVEETDSTVVFERVERNSRLKLPLPKERIHRLRDSAGDPWRVITPRGGGPSDGPDGADEAEPGDDDPATAEGEGQDDTGAAPTEDETGILPFGWRGDGSGHYPDARPPSALNIVWERKLPSWSQASPVVAGNRLFVLSQPHWLICFDRKSGEELWRQDHPYSLLGADRAGGKLPTSDFVMKTYGYTCPTPVTDGESIFCSFGHGMVVRRRLDGELVWASPYRIEHKQRSGVSQSPALAGGAVVIGAAAQDAFAGYDRESGAHRWSVSRGGGSRGKGSFQTVRHGDREYVLTSDGFVFDESGTKVQEGLIDKRNYGSTPVVHDGVVYAEDYMGKQFMAGRLNPGRPTEVLWRTPLEKGEKLSRSPLYLDGLVYLPARQMVVLDAASGAKVHSFKIEGGWSSPVVAGNRIVLVGGKHILVIRPGRDAEVERRIPHSFANKGGPDKNLGCTPVFVGNAMYHRGGAKIYCIACE